MLVGPPTPRAAHLPAAPRPPAQDEEEGGVWHFMELYTSQAALVEHSQRPEVRAFADQVRAGGSISKTRFSLLARRRPRGLCGARAARALAQAQAFLACCAASARRGGARRMRRPRPPFARRCTRTWRAAWAWRCTSTETA